MNVRLRPVDTMSGRPGLTAIRCATIFVSLFLLTTGSLPSQAVRVGPAVTTVYTFSAFNVDGVTNTDGAHLWAPLLLDSGNGLFYGVAADGGPNGTGTLFSLDTSGHLTVIHAFSALDPSTQTNDDGAHPYAGLNMAPSNGIIYGTTNAGGTGGSGTIFAYSPTSHDFATIYSFTARNKNAENTDGAVPNGGIIEASDGNLYGTTSFGGRFATGTIYEIERPGGFKTLHSFGIEPANGTGNTFAGGPYAQLVENPKGVLWGSTSYGGLTNHGSLFTMIIPSDTFTVMHFFQGTASLYNVDGYDAVGLVATPTGVLVGVAAYGGTGGDGNVFNVQPDGSVVNIHQEDPLSYRGTNIQGGFPSAPITDDKGNVYFSVCAGGEEGHGGVVKLTGFGQFKFFADTWPTQGSEPHSAVTLTPDKQLYGTTTDGGANGTGSIFMLTIPTG